MRYFANPSKGGVADAMSSGVIDCIVTPVQGNKIPDGAMVCADNGCFGKGYPGDEAWFEWLRTLPADRCRFAVAPDVVGDAAATLTRSTPWLARIRSLGMPAAFVAQNGQQHLPVPWGEFDVLFVGGTVECADHGPTTELVQTGRGGNQKFWCPECGVQIHEWKLGPDARGLVAAAKARDKWVHMGRVNSFKRIAYARHIGCDSVDGTFLIRGPDTNLKRLRGWLDDLSAQPELEISYPT